MRAKLHLISLLLALMVFSALAQTNNLEFDVLETKQGNFTNATIHTHTAAYVIVNHDEGVKFADHVSDASRDTVAQFAQLPSDLQAHLLAALREARKRGVDLMDAVFKASGGGQGGERPGLGKVIAELIVVKRTAGLHPDYLRGLEGVLNKFALGRESMPVDAVKLDLVERFLEATPLEGRPTRRARLSTLFNFAVRRKYRTDNPCDQLEAIKVPEKPKRIFMLAEVQNILRWMDRDCPRLLPWFVLSTFCGLRPEEAVKTLPESIHFREGWIRVEAQSTKVRQRRIVHPRREAMRLLKLAVEKYPAVTLTKQSRRAGFDRMKTHLGWEKWPKDVTRHTAASMWLAVEPDVARVAAMLGNSPAVLLQHYKALVTKKTATAFWSLKLLSA